MGRTDRRRSEVLGRAVCEGLEERRTGKGNSGTLQFRSGLVAPTVTITKARPSAGRRFSLVCS